MRAPPESQSPIIGTPILTDMSMTLQILAACVSDRLPPNTVKSCANRKTGRLSMRPLPVTTPSPRTWLPGASMPKSRQRCVTKRSISTNVPGSTSRSMRSRAVSLPFWCCASMRPWPPPSSDRSRISCSFEIGSLMGWILDELGQHATQVLRVHERDAAVVRTRRRHLVQHRRAALDHRVDLLLAVAYAEREVVHAGAPALQELADWRVGCDRLEQLDARRARHQDRDAHPLRRHVLDAEQLQTEARPVRQCLVDRTASDADVVQTL